MEDQEKIHFSNSDVTVTQSRFISGNKTYVMRNISSVQIGIIKRKKTTAVMLMAVGLSLFLFEATRIVGFVLLAIGFTWFLMLKDKYSVRINSNSGEVDGYISKDKSLVQEIVNAVNEAIILMK